MESLSTRLEKLRELHDTDIATKEDRAKAIPLWALLIIYDKANSACYIDYMLGLRALVDWLGEPDYTPRSAVKYDIELLHSYESDRIASITKLPACWIIECTVLDVIPRLAKAGD